MEFLYILKAVRLGMLTEGPTPDEAKIVEIHFDYLKDLADRKVLTLAGRTLNNDANTIGIAIIHAPTEEAARLIMENDPAVKKGIMTATLYPFRTAIKP